MKHTIGSGHPRFPPRWRTSSTFSVAKKLSATALSQPSPRAHTADDPVPRQHPLVVGLAY